MTIIGKTLGGFIVELEKEELESILSKPREKKRIEVGENFKIDEIFSDADRIVHLHEDALAAAGALKESAAIFMSYFKKGAA